MSWDKERIAQIQLPDPADDEPALALHRLHGLQRRRAALGLDVLCDELRGRQRVRRDRGEQQGEAERRAVDHLHANSPGNGSDERR